MLRRIPASHNIPWLQVQSVYIVKSDIEDIKHWCQYSGSSLSGHKMKVANSFNSVLLIELTHSL